MICIINLPSSIIDEPAAKKSVEESVSPPAKVVEKTIPNITKPPTDLKDKETTITEAVAVVKESSKNEESTEEVKKEEEKDKDKDKEKEKEKEKESSSSSGSLNDAASAAAASGRPTRRNRV